MPLKHVYIICGSFIFGGIVTSFLKSAGLLEYSFFINIPPGETELIFASIQATVFCSILIASRVFLGNVETEKKTEFLSFFSNKGAKYLYLLLFLILIYTYFITVYYLEDMTLDVVVRHSGNQSISRFTLLLVLVGAFFFNRGKYLQRIFVFIILIYIGTIASSMGASRAAAVPFVIASFVFFNRKNYITGAMFFYLAIVALVAAFGTRGDPSYINFWSFFASKIFSLDVANYVLVILQYSFPGLDTIQVAIDYPGELSFESFGKFIAYISPVPSSFLPKSLFENSSLSYALGIDRSVLGINYDILSEGIAWFGVGGAWIFSMFTGLLSVLPYFVVSRLLKSSNNVLYILCLMANVWMICGGMVFTLRAGSRVVWAVIILLLIYFFFRRFRLRPKNRNL